jgi:tetratricopeptide (TPR) repeat protein
MGLRLDLRAALLCSGWLFVSAVNSTAHAQSEPSEADEEQARAHFRLGRAHYDNGEFSDAAGEFESAYRISKRPALLYNLYLAYRDANDLPHAADALRHYLELEKKIENRGQLEARLAALDRSLAQTHAESQQTAAPVTTQPSVSASATPVPSPEVLTPPRAAESVAPAPPAPARPNSTNVVGYSARPNQTLPIVLAVTGGAMVVASVVTGMVTLGKKSDLSKAQADCQRAHDCNALSPAKVSDLESKKSSGQTFAVLTDVLLFGGLAVAATGAVMFLLNRGSAERNDAASGLAIACAPGGCAASWRATF